MGNSVLSGTRVFVAAAALLLAACAGSDDTLGGAAAEPTSTVAAATTPTLTPTCLVYTPAHPDEEAQREQ